MGDLHSRRDLVRWSLLGASSVPVAAILAACGDGGGSASPQATSSTVATTKPTSTFPPSTVLAASTTAASDADQQWPWWLRDNFAPVTDEVEAFDLEVRGALPPALRGLYVKNSSNPPGRDSPHWFFGDGMVHGVALDGGVARWYRNRYVQTEPHQAGLGFGQGGPGGAANQSNVSTIWHGGRLLTSGEVGFPYELRPDDLSTVGVHDFADALTGSFTAHPKIDPTTGRMHAFGYGFAPPYLSYYVVEPDGTMSTVEPVELPRSTMIHDFAITESDAVFWDLPVVFDMDLAIRFVEDPASGILPFVWQPEAGARVGVMPLGGPGGAIRWFEFEPCYVFHGVNAFRRGDEVVVDVCRLSSMFDGPNGMGGDASLRRWTLNTATGTVADDVLETVDPGDLPSRDPRRVGREHRHGYLVGTRQNPDTVDLAGVIKHDFVAARRETWDPGSTRHASEPLFVPGDAADDADDAGWLLCFVHDDADNETVLAVLDATDVATGPVAEIVMPQRVPYGFHATWIPATT